MNKISIENTYKGIKMNFLNGSIELPNQYGAYVVAPGCGAGKTTNIVNLIKEHYDEGILYSAFTIKECEDMYSRLLVLINEGKMRLSINQIAVIHSENLDGLNSYNNVNLSDKKIIICTHHKFLSGDPEAMLSTSFYYPSMTIYRRARLPKSGQPMPRKWVLIDELPTTKIVQVFKTSIARLVLNTSETIGGTYNPLTNSIEGGVRIEKKDDYNWVCDKFKRINKEVGLRFDTKMQSVASEKYISTLYENYDKYNSPDYKSDDIIIRNTVADYAFDGMIGYTILFDGTGDLTFVNNENSNFSKFKLLTYPNKYNSSINTTIIPFDGVKRTIGRSVKDSDAIDLLKGKYLDNISNCIRKGNKTLIVTWKDLRIVSNDEDYDDRSIDVTSDIKRIIEEGLLSRGIDRENYEIIHYMSGLDKATNEFRDYDQVMFLGKFQVPISVVTQFNRDYWTDTTSENYTLYQLVQAVCRTRIRNHRGESINIYFTNDWSSEIVGNLTRYLSNDSQIKSLTSKGILLNDMEFLSQFKPKWREAVMKLCNWDNNIKSFISSDKGTQLCDVSITLDEIFEIIPMSRKEVQKYYPLINYLRKFNIYLTITSRINKQIS